MATRFYLTSLTQQGTAPSTWGGGWGGTSDADNFGTKEAATTRRNSSFVTSGGINSGGTSPNFQAAGRFVSPPLTAQTISAGTTITGYMRCIESASGANATLAVYVGLVNADGTIGSTVISLAASDNTAASPPEISSSYFYSRAWNNSSEASPSVASDVSVSAGQRLVIEVGARFANTVTSRNVVFRYGDNSANDLTAEDVASDYNPWLEFSQTLTFSDPSTRTETVTVAESVTRQITHLRSVADASTVTDDTTRAMGGPISADRFDAVTVAETTRRRSWQEADAYSINTGSLVEGTADSTWTANTQYLTIQEVSGTPGFAVDLFYRSVPVNRASSFVFVGRYQGNVGHNVKLQQWNFTSSQWVNLTADAGDLPYSTTDYTTEHAVFTGADYQSGGEIRIRVLHTSVGSPTNHYLYIDQAVLTPNDAAEAQDAITVAEQVTRLGAIYRSGSETVTVAEAVTRLGIISRVVSDAVTVTPNVARLAASAQQVSDTLTVSEAVTRLSVTSLSLSDAITVSEAVTRLGVIALTVFDGITVTPASTPALNLSVQVAETVTITGAGSGPPVFDAVGGFHDAGESTLTFSHTVSGTNRALLVAVMGDGGPAYKVSTVTYNGVSLTRLGIAYDNLIGYVVTELWFLLAPATGTHNVVVTHEVSPADLCAVSASYTGVNQTVPYHGVVTNGGNNSTPLVTVLSTAEERVVDSVGGFSVTGISAGDGQTARGVQTEAIWRVGLSDELGHASTEMTWTWASNSTWAQVAAALNPATWASESVTPLLVASELSVSRAEAIHPVEAITRRVVNSRIVADTITVTDGVLLPEDITRAVSETTTVTDNVTSGGLLGTGVADTSTVSEGVTRLGVTSLTVSDSLTVIDESEQQQQASEALNVGWLSEITEWVED